MLPRKAFPAVVLQFALAVALTAPTPARAAHSDGIDPSLLAPGLVQAGDALGRLERLTNEAEAIGAALFRVHNEWGQRRALATSPPDCKTDWLLDLGARSRELGRAFRDAVQSARVQARRVESLTVEPTVQPLLDAETSHKVSSLLSRVDDLVRSYPETASWQEHYIEPLLHGCEPALVAVAGIPDAAPPSPPKDANLASAAIVRPSSLIAIIAFGGGFLCPGAVPAEGVMLVSGAICYSLGESCDCKPEAVAPATVLGPPPAPPPAPAAEAAGGKAAGAGAAGAGAAGGKGAAAAGGAAGAKAARGAGAAAGKGAVAGAAAPGAAKGAAGAAGAASGVKGGAAARPVAPGVPAPVWPSRSAPAAPGAAAPRSSAAPPSARPSTAPAAARPSSEPERPPSAPAAPRSSAPPAARPSAAPAAARASEPAAGRASDPAATRASDGAAPAKATAVSPATTRGPETKAGSAN